MANFSEIAGKSLRLILLYLKNISVNLYRRLLILAKYGAISWQNRRLGKQYRLFGQNVYNKYLAGDVNPLLQEDVKDQMTFLHACRDVLASRREAIDQIKAQIKATSYRLPAAAAPPVNDSVSEEPPAPGKQD